MMEAIYVRQSVDKKESLSIEGQIEICKKYSAEDAVVFSDKGYSGKNIKRPGFTELMSYVKSGRIRKIYVYRLDRFSRSIADFGTIWQTLEECKVEFQSVTEQFDTSTPIGRAMLNVVLVFAQLERETIAQRVKDNYIHRFKLGAWPGGPAPYGFDIIRKECEGKHVSSLAVNDDSHIVSWIFREYSKQGASLRSIAKSLDEKGIYGPKRQLWDNVTLSRILHNPLYVMADEDVYWYYVSNGIKAQQDIEAFGDGYACNVIGKRNNNKDKLLTVCNHRGFIDSELWLTVQGKLDKNTQISRANAGKYSWLTGLMKCKKCGYAIKINYNKKENRFYLLCSGRSNFSVCNCTVSVELKELEKEVENIIRENLNTISNNSFVLHKNLPSVIFAIDEKIQRLVNAVSESNEVSASYISKQIAELHKQREKLFNKAKGNDEKEATLNFTELDFKSKKIVASEFIDKILLENNVVNILWKF